MSRASGSGTAHRPRRWLSLVIALVTLISAFPAGVIQPAAAQQDGATYSVTVRKYDCPPGFDAYSQTGQATFDNCSTPQNGIPFSLTTDNGAYNGAFQNTGDAGNSDVSWGGIPLNSTFTIQEQIPSGYGLPMIYCAAYTNLWDGSSVVYPQFSYGEGWVSAYLDNSYADYSYLGCYWFNVPLNNGQGGDPGDDPTPGPDENGGNGYTVDIIKALCWDEYKADPPQGEVRIGQGEDCVPLRSNFRIEPQSGQAGDIETDEQTGFGSWSNYQGGQATLTETNPFYPIPLRGYIWCYGQGEEGNFNWEPFEGRYDFDRPAANLTCVVLNYLNYSGVVIQKIGCPSDARNESDLGDVIRDCEPLDNVDFDYSVSGGSNGTSDTDQSGVFETWAFDGTQDADYSISERMPNGYDAARVLCAAFDAGNYPNGGFSEYSFESDGSLSLRTDPRQLIVCYWFNFEEENGGGGGYDPSGTYGTVTIYKLVCDSSYDGSSSYHQDYIDNCDEQDGVEFDLSSSGGFDDTQTVNNGYAQWDKSVPYDDMTITEQAPSGYGTWKIFCGVYQDDPSEVSSYDETPYSGNTLEWSLDDGYNLICYWVNYPVNYGTITIYKLLCDPGYDSSSTYHQDYIDNCAEHDGVDFRLTGNGGYDDTQTVNNGYAQWDKSVPYGDVTIEELGSGYEARRVFCGLYQDDPSEISNYDEESLNGNSLEGFLDSGYNAVCYWVNYPSTTTGGYGRVMIDKYVCPDGYDPSSASYNDLLSNCSTPQSGMEFVVSDSVGDSNGFTGGAGSVGLADIAEGGITIRETPNSSYRSARVFCTSYEEGGSPGQYDEYVLDNGDSVSGNLSNGWIFRCYWFNEPYAGTYGTVTIYKLACDTSYDGSSTYHQDYIDNCDEYDGVEYDLYGSGNYQETQTVNNGYAQWDKTVPYGPITITERPISGYATWRVFCGVYQDDPSEISSYDPVNYYDGNSIDWALQDGFNLICYWVNYPANYGTVTIYKLVCPDGYDGSSTYHQDYIDNCDEQDGVEYDLAGQGGYSESQTVNNGYAQWDKTVPYRDIAITEFPSSGYSTWKIFCGVYQDDPSEVSSYDPANFSGNTLEWTLDEGYNLICYWVNYPAEYGTIVIYKWMCDSYDPANINQSYLETQCSPERDWEFDLYGGPYSGERRTSANDGSLTWDQLPDGTYQVAEVQQSGYQILRVYCTEYPRGDAPNTWEETSFSSSWDIEREVRSGYVIECHWFNTTYDDTYGSVTIYKYVCPDGYDSSSMSKEYLESYCTVASDFEFNVDGSGGGAGFRTTDSNGMATWSDISTGPRVIRESQVPGYRPLAVYCATYPYGGSAGSYDPYTVSSSWSISAHMQEEYDLVCYWFNEYYTPTDGTVTIYKYVCPDGYAPSGSGYQDYLDGCTDEQSGMDFDLTKPDSSVETRTVDPSNGYAQWDKSVPYGDISITERPLSGYVSYKIFCGVYQDDPSEVASYDSTPIRDSNSMDWSLDPGYSLICYWFNKPYAPTDYGDITIYKYNCPSGYDQSSATKEYLESICTEDGAGIDFELYYESDPARTESTGQDESVSWDQAAAGGYRIRELVPSGYRIAGVYCMAAPHSGPEGTYDEIPVTSDNEIWYDLPYGYSLNCYWFNAPDDYGTIKIHKYSCPDTYDTSYAGYNDLKTNCTTKHANVEFGYAENGGGPSLQITDANGDLTWDQVPYNTPISINESAPSGYQTARVYCSVVTPYSGFPGYNEYGLYNWTLTVTLGTGEFIDCYWYNIPTKYGATVIITKYACTADDWEKSRDDLYAACSDVIPSVKFYLDSVTGRSTAHTGGDGIVAWDEVPAGDVWIEETPPSGYGRSRVFCTVTSGGTAGSLSEASVQGGVAIQYGLDAGDVLECSWYNFPYDYDGGTVTVYKYYCDTNTPASSSRSSLKYACDTWQGVKFSLSPKGQQSESRTTGHDGTATWQTVPEGNASLRETTTSGYKTPIVFCSVDGGSWTRNTLQSGKATLPVTSGGTIICEWFNIPNSTTPSGPSTGQPSTGSGGTTPNTGTTPGTTPRRPTPRTQDDDIGGDQPNASGPATLTVVVFRCENGYDLYEFGIDPEKDCEAATEELSFSLTEIVEQQEGDPAPRPVEETSREPRINQVTFSGIDSGDYLLTSLADEALKVGHAFIYSCEQPDGDAETSRFTPFVWADGDLTVRISLDAGEDLTCNWYEVPSSAGEVQFTVFTCPGRTANLSRCTPAADPITIEIAKSDTIGDFTEATTGEGGIATVALAAGSYGIDTIERPVCLIDSAAIDDSGDLVVEDDQEEGIEVKIYTCAA